MAHPLVTQLRFARSEFLRCLDSGEEHAVSGSRYCRTLALAFAGLNECA